MGIGRMTLNSFTGVIFYQLSHYGVSVVCNIPYWTWAGIENIPIKSWEIKIQLLQHQIKTQINIDALSKWVFVSWT